MAQHLAGAQGAATIALDDVAAIIADVEAGRCPELALACVATLLAS